MTLPHSEPLEAALVARLLVDPGQLPVLVGQLGPEDFFVGAWRRAYAAMQKLSATGKVVDIESLRAEIGEDADELARRLGEITSAHRAPVGEYAGMVRDFAFRRRLISILNGFVTKAQERGDREVLLAELHEAVQQISAGMEEGALLSPSQAVDAYLRVMDDRARGERQGLTWGLEPLDRILLPARGGEMIILAARPSIGKTALAEQIASHWAQLGPHPVLFASLEMPTESLLDRTVSRTTGVPGLDVIRGILTEPQEARVKEALAKLRANGLPWYLDDSYATTGALRAAAARVRLLAGGLTAIVVDYLGLLKDPHDSEVTRVTRISRNLKAIAREFNVPMLVLSQLNRAAEAREDNHPRLQDLRDSGALEQDADRVLGLWRPDRASPIADLDVLKARQGVTGRIYLGYDGEHFRFKERDDTDTPTLDDDFEHFA